ncbi:MAG: tetratricopeptide repeat protein [Acidobacteriota bacterium]
MSHWARRFLVFAIALLYVLLFSSQPCYQIIAQNHDQAATAKAADEFFQRKDWNKAVPAYQAITKAEPENGQAWYRLGYALHALGQYREAIEAFQHMLAIRPNPIAMYNIACSYAKLNEKDHAYQWLEKAMQNGFIQLQVLESDADLENLRSDARFSEIQKKMLVKAQPCKFLPEARQFDFWIGEWEVKTQDGRLVGNNSVQLILGDCVIYENWTGTGGGSGKSFNLFNQNRGKWQQTWVDSQGSIIEFVEGEYRDNAMKFRAEIRTQDGNVTLRRLTFYNLDPNRVRQYSEISRDNGKNWQTEYDFYYYRKK